MRFVSRLSDAEISGLMPLRYEVTRGPAYNDRCVCGAISRVQPAEHRLRRRSTEGVDEIP